ncbi:MAG: lactoylglutathione lyase [Proteobacteria bacterium]|jgi:lactoylglutathione lyase|nr:VOC family protein [Deltaproteobacteria bacterium]MDP6332002.1 VOC family protein [SAR324 cluster bacterium]MDP6886687.1 VOC family protein [SAR324 cluster bacterium]RZO47009.1 MAG: lactoylglutathione lyase [Pseudomonadota bacterium]HJL94257.1 VOC family protein [SAR324 cluster bacterium]|tara:strand:+ start:1946 stop:2365 length:420 start_codon:yes stop_codon:yes gene_type:complete
MKYLHTMIRVQNLERALDFFINKLGMTEVRRKEVPEGEFTLIFLAATEDEPPLELTYNWKQNEPYSNGENFGHIAYGVENIYKFCEKLQNNGVTILRPPKDGKMAFVRSPDQISVELLQIGEPLPIQEPWASMKNQGTW